MKVELGPEPGGHQETDAVLVMSLQSLEYSSRDQMMENSGLKLSHKVVDQEKAK